MEAPGIAIVVLFGAMIIAGIVSRVKKPKEEETQVETKTEE